MQSRTNWSKWADILRHFKLEGLASWLLEAGLPLSLLGAQVLYMGQPFLGGKKLESIAQLLEDEDETQALIHYLRGKTT